jgi:UDP-N-acetylmuramoylalanine--D-glutamate ligase
MIPLHAIAGGCYGVLGLGLSGTAACRALLAAGHAVAAWDDTPAVRAQRAADGIPIVDLRTVSLDGLRALVLSPGIPHTFPAPHPVVARAKAAGLAIIGDGELLAAACPEATFVGVTGTNGKSTTTALIGHILKAAGRPVEVGGNLGTAVLDLAPLAAGGIYVLEMSSYQLELTPSLVFNFSTLLNISPDHLGRHGGMNGYVAAKRLIFRGNRSDAVAVVGVDDEHASRIADDVAAGGRRRVVPISAERPVAGGVYVENGRLIDDLGGRTERAVDLAAASALPGRHNAQNAAAAWANVRLLGVDAAVAGDAILSFPGLAHRQERIACINGVTYVNDSKATNADAAVRALTCYAPIYWIAGGRPKEDGLRGVEPHLGRVRKAFLIGEAEDAFAAALAGHVPVRRCGTLDCAVAAARAEAEAEALPGAVVLLSPACASFDQFPNFERRGDAFRALVEAFAR